MERGEHAREATKDNNCRHNEWGRGVLREDSNGNGNQAHAHERGERDSGESSMRARHLYLKKKKMEILGVCTFRISFEFDV